jgi:hypothetical protein
MIPVSTSGRVVCCAFLGSCDCATTGALPKRWAFAIIAVLTACARRRGGPPPVPPVGTRVALPSPVTITAACTASRTASVHVAMRGPWASKSVRHFSGAGSLSSHEAAFIGSKRSCDHGQTGQVRAYGQRRAQIVRHTRRGNHTGACYTLSSNCFYRSKGGPSSQACVAVWRPL